MGIPGSQSAAGNARASCAAAAPSRAPASASPAPPAPPAAARRVSSLKRLTASMCCCGAGVPHPPRNPSLAAVSSAAAPTGAALE